MINPGIMDKKIMIQKNISITIIHGLTSMNLAEMNSIRLDLLI